MYIKEQVSNTIIIEKSKFIAFLMPCHDENEYKEILKSIKKKYFDATHVCSAFIGKNIRRSSDDGEPSGTAGVPMISVLDKAEIENTCAIVVRYFGGFKLGAGGLIRAYSSSVSEALKLAILVKDEEYSKYQLILNYDLANKVDYLLSKETINLTKSYDTEVTFNFLSNDQKIINKIEELTSGKKPVMVGKETIQKVVE